MLNINDRVRVVKGCNARGVQKGVTMVVRNIKPLGADYSHSVHVSLEHINGPKHNTLQAWYARHINRLNDETINLNDGNPLHAIKIRKLELVAK